MANEKKKCNYRFPDEKLIDWIEFDPPMEIDLQYSLLWNYRLSLAIIDALKRDLKEERRRREVADRSRDEMGKMLQEWIKENSAKKESVMRISTVRAIQ